MKIKVEYVKISNKFYESEASDKYIFLTQNEKKWYMNNLFHLGIFFCFKNLIYLDVEK